MKISIITVTRNSSATVADTILSIARQTYKNIEHIIIDGASTDNTLEVIKNAGHKGPVISETDNGIYDAMNKGLRIATGDIIGILNSDDFYPDHSIIERVVCAFEDKSCGAVYGDLFYVDANSTDKITRKWISGPYHRKNFYKGWMPPHPTVFLRKELYEEHGYFNQKLKSSSDYELLLRFLVLKGTPAKYLSQVLVHMRVGGKSNKSIWNRIIAHFEDYKAWYYVGIFPKWYTLMLKPVRKISQFVVLDNNKSALPEYKIPAQLSQSKLYTFSASTTISVLLSILNIALFLG